MRLALSKQGSRTINALQTNLPNTVLLTGSTGIGLKTIAMTLGDSPQLITPELKTKTSTIPQISIETIRELYTDTRTKSLKARVIIIDDADKMSLSAQNSFLKLLEEPSSHTHFVLTSHHPERLLPTVRSRLQSHHFPTLSETETIQFLTNFPSQAKEKQAQLLFIASGLPAEITRLIEDDAYFESAKVRMQLVRQLLETDRYDRLVTVMKSSLNRNSALELIEAATYVLSRQPTESKVILMKRLLTSYQHIQNGGNIKLHLMNAVV